MIKKLCALFAAGVIWFASFDCVRAEEVIAKCIAVTSGTGCVVRIQDNLLQVQLWGVSEVKSNPEFAAAAQQELSDLINNKEITVEVVNRSEDGTCFSKVYVDGAYVNSAMLSDGFGMLNQAQAGTDDELSKAETNAKKDNKGCWQQGTATSDTNALVPSEEEETIVVPDGTETVTVTRVVDGDTLAIVTASGAVTRICLYGCDAPEKGQQFDEESREALRKTLEGKTIRIQITEKDSRRIKTAKVYADGVYVNRRMLSRGYGIKPPSCKDDDLAEAENRATLSKRGLWIAGTAVIAPWSYRQIAEGRRADAERRRLEQQAREEQAEREMQRMKRLEAQWRREEQRSSSSSGGPVHVRGYYRKDGTYVQPHTRSR